MSSALKLYIYIYTGVLDFPKDMSGQVSASPQYDHVAQSELVQTHALLRFSS